MVSVIMPVYNRQGTIERAVESIRNQTYQDWKLIIVDDGSSDNTQSIVESYVNLDSRISYIRNEKNMGPAHTRNTGLTQANGDYIAFLDSDDEWINDHLEECVEALEKEDYKICSALWYEECDGVLTKVRDLDWFQCSIEYMKDPTIISEEKKYWKFGSDFFQIVLDSGLYCYHINTIVMKREVIDKMGLFNETLKSSEDLEFLYRIFEKYSLITVNKEHFIYHYGKDNIYAYVDRSKVSIEYFVENQKILQKHVDNQINKINSYNMICKRISDSKVLVNKTEILYLFRDDTFRRGLTIAYLCKNKDKRLMIRYYFISLRFARNFTMFYQWLTFTKKKSVEGYFKND